MKRHVLVNPDSSGDITKRFKSLDIEPIVIPRSIKLHHALSGHPDLQFFVHGEMLFTHPELEPSFMKRIGTLIEMRTGESTPGAEYPLDCAYNIACTGKFAFHRSRYSERSILDHLEQKEIPMIDVKQGYSRCSTLIVDETAIITSDTVIHRKALDKGLSSLAVNPGHVVLPGFRYGFIGGASGFDSETVYLSGDPMQHPDGEQIVDFINARGKKVVSLSEGPLVDMGSFLLFESA